MTRRVAFWASCLLLLLLFHQPSGGQSRAVISVDLGSEWFKVGVVSHGVPLAIALNAESKRKTPSVLSIRDGLRTFGEQAHSASVRHPQDAYHYVLDLVGKNRSHPIVAQFLQRFPYYRIEDATDNTDGIYLQPGDSATRYRPVEILAQFLSKAKDIALFHLDQGPKATIRDCVITVPGYFNQVERAAILQAAQLANLTVLQLINDYLAVAVNYGIFRMKDFNETAQNILFYDMGASSTTAALVSYHTVKTKDTGRLESHPQATVLGVGFDRTLGGLEVQIRLRDYLAAKFNEAHPGGTDVGQNVRAMAKLLKEAGRVKNVLSANTETLAQVENLMDDIDFRVMVRRTDLNTLIAGDFERRITQPIQQALNTAQLGKEAIQHVILFGGGTRVPRVQEVLHDHLAMNLGHQLNADEAAAVGAAYKAADLTTGGGFQVRKFLTKDVVFYPIEVQFAKAHTPQKQLVRRTLFNLMNPYPQKKVITFNRHTDDFQFSVNYADQSHLSAEQLVHLGAQNLSTVQLQQVSETLAEHTAGEHRESKGIRAHFVLNESGILHLNNVELMVEETVLSTNNNNTDSDGDGDESVDGASTFAKLGSTLSKLFATSDEDTNSTTTSANTSSTTEPLNTTTTNSVPNNTNEATAANDGGEQTTTTTTTTTTTPKEPPQPRIVVHKITIPSEEHLANAFILNAQGMAESASKLHTLAMTEFETARRISALNELETFVIDVQMKMSEPAYQVASTAEQVAALKQICTEIGEWLYEDGVNADTNTYEQKLHELKDLTRELFLRVLEHSERPRALTALKLKLNQSRGFLTAAKNISSTTIDLFSSSDIESLETLIDNTEEWLQRMELEQNATKPHEEVKLTVQLMVDKIDALARELVYLDRKLKMWRPKILEKPMKEIKVNDSSKYNDSDEATLKTEEEEGPIVLDSVPTDTVNSSVVDNAKESTIETDEHSEL